jgi:hypothetical protein
MAGMRSEILYGFVNLLKFSLLNGLSGHTSSNFPPLSQIF